MVFMRCSRVTRSVAALLVLTLGLGAAGCAAVQVDYDPSFDFGAKHTWAWGSETVPYEEGMPYLDFRRAVEAELEALGLRESGPDQAALVFDFQLHVATKQQNNDPYFSAHVAKKYEEGTFALDVFEAESLRRVWRGEIRDRLRYVARAMNSYPPRFVNTGEPRTWEVENMVRSVLREFPRSIGSRGGLVD